MPNEPDRQLLLDYIGKVHVALIETGKTSDRITLTLLIETLFTVALTANLIKVSEKFSFAGLSVEAGGLSLILIASVYTILFTYSYMLGLWQHTEELQQIIIKLYSQLGLSDKSLKNTEASPLEPPHFLTVISKTSQSPPFKLGKLTDYTSQALMYSCVLLAPIIAQGMSTWRVAALVLNPRFKWLAISACALAIVITILQLITRGWCMLNMMDLDTDA